MGSIKNIESDIISLTIENMKYKVVITYDDESTQTIVMAGREEALKCARANKWAMVYTI